ncbi:MAG: nucleotidyltransferase [Desulfurococcaceae archaeon]
MRPREFVIMFSAKTLRETLSKLIDNGVRFVIIGGTALQLELGHRQFEGDLDLFVISPSPLSERDFYESLCEREGWELTRTEEGFMKIVIPTDEGHLEVELYENYLDFEIPDEIIESARSVTLNGLRVKIIRPEHYIILKARQGAEVDELKGIYRKYERAFNAENVRKGLELFPEEEREIVKRKLVRAGVLSER